MVEIVEIRFRIEANENRLDQQYVALKGIVGIKQAHYHWENGGTYFDAIYVPAVGYTPTQGDLISIMQAVEESAGTVSEVNDLPQQIIMQEYLPLFGNRNRVLYRLEGDHYWFARVLEGERTHAVTNMTLGELKALVARDTELREASYASGLSDEWNTGTIKLITDPILVTEMLESYEKES